MILKQKALGLDGTKTNRYTESERNFHPTLAKAMS